MKIALITLLVLVASCSGESNKEFELLRPNPELIKEKLENGEIQRYNQPNDMTLMYIDSESKISFFFDPDGKLLKDSWSFELKEFSLSSIEDILNKKVKDYYGYLIPFDEEYLIKPTEKCSFSIINTDNNCTFLATVVNRGDNTFSLFVDYYYQSSTVVLPEGLKLQ